MTLPTVSSVALYNDLKDSMRTKSCAIVFVLKDRVRRGGPCFAGIVITLCIKVFKTVI